MLAMAALMCAAGAAPALAQTCEILTDRGEAIGEVIDGLVADGMLDQQYQFAVSGVPSGELLNRVLVGLSAGPMPCAVVTSSPSVVEAISRHAATVDVTGFNLDISDIPSVLNAQCLREGASVCIPLTLRAEPWLFLSDDRAEGMGNGLEEFQLDGEGPFGMPPEGPMVAGSFVLQSLFRAMEADGVDAPTYLQGYTPGTLEESGAEFVSAWERLKALGLTLPSAGPEGQIVPQQPAVDMFTNGRLDALIGDDATRIALERTDDDLNCLLGIQTPSLPGEEAAPPVITVGGEFLILPEQSDTLSMQQALATALLDSRGQTRLSAALEMPPSRLEQPFGDPSRCLEQIIRRLVCATLVPETFPIDPQLFGELSTIQAEVLGGLSTTEAMTRLENLVAGHPDSLPPVRTLDGFGGGFPRADLCDESGNETIKVADGEAPPVETGGENQYNPAATGFSGFSGSISAANGSSRIATYAYLPPNTPNNTTARESTTSKGWHAIWPEVEGYTKQTLPTPVIGDEILTGLPETETDVPSDDVFIEDISTRPRLPDGRIDIPFFRIGFLDQLIIRSGGGIPSVCSATMLSGGYALTIGHCVEQPFTVHLVGPEHLDCLDSAEEGFPTDRCGIAALEVDGAPSFFVGDDPLAIIKLKFEPTRYADISGVYMATRLVTTLAGRGRFAADQLQAPGQLQITWAQIDLDDPDALNLGDARDGGRISLQIAGGDGVACSGDSGGGVYRGRMFGYADEDGTEVHELIGVVAAGGDGDGCTSGGGIATKIVLVQSSATLGWLCEQTNDALKVCMGKPQT